jgi:xanthine dehydrogenase iron-sulfur cluster and FAD-binding subunit A
MVLIASRTQVVSQMNPTTGKLYHASVNACLAPLVSVDGKHVITVEVGHLSSLFLQPG